MVEKIRGCCTNSEEKGEDLIENPWKKYSDHFSTQEKAANIDLETLDSVLSMLLQILALNHLLVSNFVLDQLQICKKAPLARWSRSTHLHYCMFPGNSFNTQCVKALQ